MNAITPLPLPEPVLVVEDNDTLASLLGLHLSRLHFRAHRAANRVDALAIAGGIQDLGLVLLDLGLPPRPNEIHEGIRAMEELLAENPRLKVVVLTGQERAQAALAAIRAGAFDFLSKPFSTPQLSASLERARLFLDQERQLFSEGESRISLTARIDEGLREAGDTATEKLLRQVLAETRFNISEAARRFDTTREHLYYFLKKYGIQRHA